MTHPWHAEPGAHALSRLGVTEHGLTQAEVDTRRAQHGPNRLPQAKATPVWKLALRQLMGPLPLVLLVAALVSWGLGHVADAVFITVSIAIDVAIGTFQEARAEASAAALRQLIRSYVTVTRDGARQSVEGEALVPGDIVFLESGVRLPADMRLLAAHELTVDESQLTGESTTVSKHAEATVAPDAPLGDRHTMAHAGSLVAQGRAKAVVVATGRATVLGGIAGHVTDTASTRPPLLVQLDVFVRRLMALIVVGMGAVAALLMGQGLDVATIFLVVVALAVAAIPEGLSMSVTVALAVATRRMAGLGVIVRHLPTVEGLGSCTLILSDKTGTLTLNEMTIARLELPTAGTVDVEGKGYTPVGGVRQNGAALSSAAQAEALALARAGVACNEASLTVGADGQVTHVGDTVDVAFLVLGEKVGVRRPAEAHLHQLAFEAHRKYAATVHLLDGVPYVAVKGAAEVVLPMCRDQNLGARLTEAHALAAQGYRVMAVAGAPWPHDTLSHEALQGLHFLGFVALLDPLRPDVPEALARCRAAGVAVRMVTGDHPATALAISRMMGLAHTDTDVLTGADMTRLAPNPMALESAIRAAKVYARVDPAQKLQIVKAMQRSGHIVAVTGDGVNDAPALHAAHIGVAMGKGGTDVAREAADLILTDDNFSRIVHGIEQGRIAYANVRKVVYFLLSTGMASVVMFVVALAAGAPLPLFAPQLLWLNLVANGLQDVGLSFEKGEPGLLNQPPRPRAQPLLNWSLALEVGLTGGLMGLLGAGMFLFWLGSGLSEAEARNLLLLLLISLGNMQALNVRSEKQSVFRVPLSANWFLVLAVVGSQLVHMAAMYTPGLSDVLGLTPISPGDWAEVVGLAALLLAVSEAYKAVWRYAATWAIRSRDDTSASGDRP